MNFLACDLGGTKVLLGIFENVINDDSPKLLIKKKYTSSEWGSFELILENFLKYECWMGKVWFNVFVITLTNLLSLLSC